VGSTITEKQFQDLRGWTDAFYRSNEDLFKQRVAEGRIRDCHGDLHMEHVCFTQPMAMIDCIEFNERFRYGDTLVDIAFLLMDLAYHGGERFSEILWDAYKKLAGESGTEPLLRFYKVYRAFVRGKVNSFQSVDQGVSSEDRDKAVETARKYFHLAHSYI
jgi:aminoglycoside phosphotransferase family enzyme